MRRKPRRGPEGFPPAEGDGGAAAAGVGSKGRPGEPAGGARPTEEPLMRLAAHSQGLVTL